MKNQSFLIRSLCLFAFALSFFSCSTAKLASPAEAERLRTMSPPADKALVYFVRPAFAGSAIGMKVTCDGEYIGTTKGKRYIYTLVDPGKHEFVSHAENKDELALVAQAGETYFIEQQITIGIAIARNRLEILDEQEGRRKLAKCKLSGKCPAYTAQGQ